MLRHVTFLQIYDLLCFDFLVSCFCRGGGRGGGKKESLGTSALKSCKNKEHHLDYGHVHAETASEGISLTSYDKLVRLLLR